MLKRLTYEPPMLTEVFKRWKIESNKQEGKLGQLKGKRAEERALLAAESLSLEFRWIQDVRFATKSEDSRGIDIVVQTSIGPLFLQVKSTKSAARTFKRRKRKARIAVVVITSACSDQSVRQKVHDLLHVQRNHILELRRKSARKRKARP